MIRFSTQVWSLHQTRGGSDRIRTDLVPEDYRVEPFDSLFEQRVFNRVHGRGYSVIPQFPAEGYKIDLVVVGANGNLAIECDGDTWHGPEHYLRDLARQRDLERCGWTFFRIRESAYYLDPAEALAELWPKLEELNTVSTPTTVPVKPPRDAIDDLATEPPTGENWHAPAPMVPVGDSFPPRLEAEALESRSTPVASFDGFASSDAFSSDDVGEPTPEEVPVATTAVAEMADGYEEYRGCAVPTQSATKAQIIDALVEVVRVEGPVRGSRLLTAYVKAYGGQKVGSQIAKDLKSAITAAVRQNLLVEDNPLGEVGVKPRTYRLPEQPSHRVRPLGPRTLEDVPPLELAARLRDARNAVGNNATPTALYRAVLDQLGLKRLTPNVEQTLARASELADSTADA